MYIYILIWAINRFQLGSVSQLAWQAHPTERPFTSTTTMRWRHACPDNTPAPRGTWVVYNLSCLAREILTESVEKHARTYMDSLGKLEFSEKKHKSNESWDSEQIAKTPADCWSNSVFEFCMFLASLWEFTQFTLPLCPVAVS